MQSPNVHLFVDQYKLYELANGSQRKKTDTAQTAKTLSQAVKILGPVSERIALIEEHDQKGLDAFQKASFQVQTMNGERDTAIHRFIRSMRDRIQYSHPRYLVAVTNDPLFHHYLFHDPPTHDTELRVLIPGREIPLDFQNANYDVRLLNDIIPEPKPTRYDVRIDYENIHIGLERNGFSVSPKQLINAIKHKVAELGDVGTITAYADWDLLSRGSRHNIQRELALISGVETRYQPNEKGKNSADMVIANEIRTVVEKPSNAPDAVDIIILCTGDRDFRPVVDTAKSRDKKVVIFTIKGTLSAELRQAADEVYYFDDMLGNTLTIDPKKPPKPTHPQAELVMKFLAFLKDHHWTFAYANRVEALFGHETETKLREGVTAQLLKEEKGQFSPNLQQPLVLASQHLLQWVTWRLKTAKAQRGWDAVHASYLYREMGRDRKLQGWQIGRDWDEAAAWMRLIATTGTVVEGSQPHPHKPNKTITTWALAKPAAKPKSSPNTTAESTSEQAVEPIKSDPSQHSDQSQPDNQDVLHLHHRRLQILKKRAAAQGASADPSLLIEIEDLEQEIKTLETAD